MRMSNLFVMLSYECDNQLYIVMVHFDYCFAKAGFYLDLFFLNGVLTYFLLLLLL